MDVVGVVDSHTAEGIDIAAVLAGCNSGLEHQGPAGAVGCGRRTGHLGRHTCSSGVGDDRRMAPCYR